MRARVAIIVPCSGPKPDAVGIAPDPWFTKSLTELSTPTEKPDFLPLELRLVDLAAAQPLLKGDESIVNRGVPHQRAADAVQLDPALEQLLAAGIEEIVLRLPLGAIQLGQLAHIWWGPL